MHRFLVVALCLFIAGGAYATDLGSTAPEKGNDHIGINHSSNTFRQGGEDIASATPIDALPYYDTGTTAGHVDDYDEECPYPGSTSPDVVYVLNLAEGASIDVDICESAYDTKLYIYDDAMTALACNDDAGCGTTGYMSKIEAFPVTAGVNYYIVVDGYGGDQGDYVISVEGYEECILDPPAPPFTPEGEPHLGPDYVDVTNGGCNSDPNVYGQIVGDVNGEAVLWARSGWYTSGGDNRDTDWYEVVAGGSQISVTAESEQVFWVVAAMPPFDCENLTLGADVELQPCEAGSFVIDTVPGETYWIIALPTTFTGPVPEFRYILNVSGLEADFIPSEFPDIALSTTDLDLGDVPIGEEGQAFVTVQNIGLQQLDLTCSASGDFSVMPSAMSLDYLAEDDLVITITPMSGGLHTGTLTINSNDPDDPVVTVALSCTGADSPVIEVSPASFDVTVASGSTADYPLTISNTGAVDLNYSIEIAGEVRSTVQFGDTENNDIIASGQAVPIASLPWTEQTMSIGGTTDIDASSAHGSASGLNATTRGEQIFGDTSNVYGPGGTRNRGNFFYCDTSTTLLEHRFYLNATAAGEMWFLVYEGASDIGTYNLISSAQITGAGPGEGWYSSGDIDVPLTEGNYYILTTYWDAACNYYNQQGISPYPIDTEFGQLVTALGWAWGFTAGVPPVASVDVPADPFSGDPIAYHQAIVTGSGTSWLSVAPASGTVAPAGSDDVTVTFDTANLCGDSYSASLVVSSNDLATPVVTVPVTMSITGTSPNLDVPPIADFGDAFVFDIVDQTITISNTGCATLDITDIVTTGDFSASEAAAILEPAETLDLVVSFFPLTLGAHTGTLTFTSNDPDTPEMVIDLTGNAIGAPVVGTTPDAIELVMNLGNTNSRTLTVSNTGDSDLDFNAAALLDIVARSSYEYTPHAKGEEDLNVGGRGSGGPDAFGYSWIDSDEPGGPTYDWVDATSGTLAFSEGDDSSHGPFDIGFDFEYYGQTFNSVLLCSNGFISFTDNSTPYSNGMFPDPSSPGNCIAPFWEDLNPTDGGDCYILQDGNDFIIQYNAFVPYGGAGGPYTFEVILSADGTITYQYNTMGAPVDGATVGMQNADGSDGFMVVFNAPYIHDELAIEISAGAPWMTVYPEAGTVPAGGTLDLAVDFNTEDVDLGTYYGAVRIDSNDPITPQLDVPVTLEVSDVQAVMLSNSSVIADADGVHLSWELSLTEENIYFNVMRSPAGENNYAALNIIPEANTPLSYLASDTSAEPGVSYNYRVNFSLDDNSSVLFTSEAIMVPIMPNALHANVPNPFNPSTKITYDLSQPSMVKLTVYDIAGRVVCNLVNEHVGAGSHDVIWAGQNNKGEPVTSGIYFYLVEAGDFRQSKRMMLVK